MTMPINGDFARKVQDILSRQSQIKQKQAQIKEDIAALSEHYGVTKAEVSKAIKLAEKEAKSPGAFVIEERVIEMARYLVG